jgi:hypothetical protein
VTQQFPYPGQPYPNSNPPPWQGYSDPYPRQYPVQPPGQGYPYRYPQQYPVQPHAAGPVFQVRPMKHTGLVIAWYNRRFTVTGTFAQCEAAIKSAQVHNLSAGWWSFASVILWNWIAIVTNIRERKRLRQSAAHAGPAAAQ